MNDYIDWETASCADLVCESINQLEDAFYSMIDSGLLQHPELVQFAHKLETCKHNILNAIKKSTSLDMDRNMDVMIKNNANSVISTQPAIQPTLQPSNIDYINIEQLRILNKTPDRSKIL